MILWSFVTNFMIPSELQMSNNLPSDIILLVTLLIFYFVPYSLMKLENGYKYIPLLKIIGFVSTVLLCPFKDNKSTNELYLLVAMINFDLVFVA